jgi:hypothetical protein
MDYLILEEDNKMLFATQHEWSRLIGEQFKLIRGYMIISMSSGSGGVFQVLRDYNPFHFPEANFKLLKITTDEETGKVIMYVMDITSAEAEQFKTIQNSLWENLPPL